MGRRQPGAAGSLREGADGGVVDVGDEARGIVEDLVGRLVVAGELVLACAGRVIRAKE